ncbi:MarR family transcriptional regulator [Mycolicibacter terrae]|jgi:DNA-binding MarR family transcriptional regulator|uniref:MarR family transcriptional regulator n=2 Tax=Mycolicibacter terrae TaxID=1788 RepID=A0ACD2EHB8_9MYCO|nr:MarR family transcriptional regulator [Mycolicibacter terrae]
MIRLPGLDDVEQETWQQFVEASMGLLAVLNRHLMEQHRLNLFELRLLDFLTKSDNGSARMSELAEELMLLRSRVTWLTGRLEVRGLLHRVRNPGDGRGVLAEITPDGRMRVREATKTYAQQVRLLYVNRMSRQQMLALGASCDQINTSLKAAGLPAKPGHR